MHKTRTTQEILHDLSLALWTAHWKVQCAVKNCETCDLLADVKEMLDAAEDRVPQREWLCRCHCCGIVYDYWHVKDDSEKSPPHLEQSGTAFTGKKMCGCGSTLYHIMGIVERIQNMTGGQGVFCLDHRKVMTDGKCPKCSQA